MKNKLYIMCGCPGSGKTTFAKSMFPNAYYVSRDEIRFSYIKENDEYFSKEDKVFNEFIKRINFALSTNKDVVADATHLNAKSRMKLLAHLDINKEKTEVHAIVMQTPLKTCIERNENRKGTKSYVPKSVIKRMYYSFTQPTNEECYGIIDTISTIKPKRST